MDGDRLTGLDAGFLDLERPDQPLHIGGLVLFEGAPLRDASGRVDIERIRRLVAGHLHRLPRFRRKVQPAAFGYGLPRWVDAPQFDVADHVTLVELDGPGTEEKLVELAGRLHAEMLPRDRPLWQMVFVDGLADGRVGLVHKVHHALVDGVSGAESLAVLLDVAPTTEVPEPVPWDPMAPPPPLAVLADTVAEAVRRPVEAVQRAMAAARPDPAGARGGRDALDQVVAFTQQLRPGPRTSLNAPISTERRYLVVPQALDDVKRAARALDAKVNDVVLAAVTTGLRRLLERRDELAADSEVQVMVPVSVRRDADRLALGNMVSSMFVRLPVAEADPAARLRTIVATTARLKDSEEPGRLQALVASTDWWDPTVRAWVERTLIPRQPYVNLVVTNVPGPQVPLFLLDARMLDAYPFVPLAGNLTVGVAVFSYDGHLNLGITADPVTCPDAEVLAGGIEDGFAELAPGEA